MCKLILKLNQKQHSLSHLLPSKIADILHRNIFRFTFVILFSHNRLLTMLLHCISIVLQNCELILVALTILCLIINSKCSIQTVCFFCHFDSISFLKMIVLYFFSITHVSWKDFSQSFGKYEQKFFSLFTLIILYLKN